LFAGFAAVWATHGFILESLFLIKGLFAFGKNEFALAVFANESFVGHDGLLGLISGFKQSGLRASRKLQGTGLKEC
jgi:hypothetical protein